MMEKKLGNYSNIKYYCISNGDGIGTSVYLSGCHFHCKGCQNSSIWGYNSGSELTYQVIRKIMASLSNEHINHLSILGGEPLDKANLFSSYELVTLTRFYYGNKKKIWLWTGYTLEELEKMANDNELLYYILNNIDYLVDGRYEEDNRDLKRKYSGSTNQRAIDMKKTIKENRIVTLED